MSNKAPSHYLGLTIGPVVKTLMSAEKTRHFWAASYTFSYLMKMIAQAFDEKHPGRIWLKPGACDDFKDAFRVAKDRKNPALRTTGAGTFGDHLVVSSDSESDVAELRQISKSAILAYAEKVTQKLNREREKDQIKDHFLRYFQVYIVRKAVPEGENPILVLSDVLNTVELQQLFPTQKPNYLHDFFNEVNDSFLTEDAFGESHSFRSIPEIGLTSHLLNPVKNADGLTCQEYVNLQELEAKKKAQQKKEKPSENERYHEWVKAFIEGYNKDHKDDPISFLTAHKYIAIVQTDGDNIGALLKELPPSKLTEFSEILTEFAAEAADLVREHDGMPVYFGGDDGLFFAPVVHGKKNVFQLLEALNKRFTDKFRELEGVPSVPTLSFGLSITYSKFPLYEALDQAWFLLNDVAKYGLDASATTDGEKNRNRKKNNVAFRVLKHSGSAFGGMIHLDPGQPFSIWNAFMKVFSRNLASPNEALRSIIYRLPDNLHLFDLIGKDQNKLEHFLDNSFDEDIHLDRKDYIDAVAHLIQQVYEHYWRYPDDTGWEAFETPNRMAYSLLKTIAFLTTPEIKYETTNV